MNVNAATAPTFRIRASERFAFDETQNLSVLLIIDTNRSYLVVAPLAVDANGNPCADHSLAFQVFKSDLESTDILRAE